MRLQHWITRLARQHRTTQAVPLTGEEPFEVTSRLYNALANLYSPLDVAKQEIRIAVLSPGEFESDIHCQLVTVSLLDNPGYEALSYAWGDARPLCRIYINGVRCTIASNLMNALRHLRDKDKPRTIWVDALCINQTVIAERNSQVKSMGTIYRKASRVLAWLGPEYDDSDLAFDFFRAMPKDLTTHWNVHENPELTTVITMPHVNAVNTLFERSWWHRVWTVQESALGQELYFFCGRRQVRAEDVFTVANGYFRHIYGCCQDIWHSTLNPRAGLGDAAHALARLEDIRTRSDMYGFEAIVSMFMSRHSSDPRDKIYGLLGLAGKQEASIIQPDYSKSVEKIFEEVAYSLMEASQELSLLSMQFPKNMEGVGSRMHGLPSWVPNWALDEEPTLLYDLDDRLSCLHKFKASGDSSASLKRTDTGGLSVRGMFISQIAVLSENQHHWDAAEDLAAFFEKWQAMFDIQENPTRLYIEKTSTTYADAFWQTLCCSLIPDLINPRDVKLAIRTSNDSEYKQLYDAWWQWCKLYNSEGPKLPLVKSQYSQAEINSMSGLISTCISMRRMFHSGDMLYMGLVPMDAQVGDLIVLLEGGRVPYVLRKVEAEGHDCYRLVGDAYVHGVMDGEKWSSESLENIILV